MSVGKRGFGSMDISKTLLCVDCGLIAEASIHVPGSGHGEFHPWQGPGVSAVNHPKHYNAHPAGIECITVVEHMGFNIGNAVKYLWRNGLKDQAPAKQDLEKAIWYIQREIERIGKVGK